MEEEKLSSVRHHKTRGGVTREEEKGGMTEEEKKNLADGKIAKPELTCMKCGYVKPNELTHHCSRCGRCCENMDHHCYYTDNCIGKRNLRFFLQFTAWGVVSLSVALFMLIVMFYIQNQHT